MTTILLWDIDGTLLTTGRAGIFAWEDAAREVTGREVDFSTLRTAGLTDFQVGATILESLGMGGSDAEGDHGALLPRLVCRYEELLPASLPRRQGRVLDNVRELLDHVRDHRPDVGCYLLTGNTRAGARAKLTYYGLQEYFAGGAFSEDTSDRPSIARKALELAGGRVALDRVFVIGDTPHDIHCGRAIGARTVAVATGGYSLEELRAHDPWRAFEILPEPQRFLALVDGCHDVRNTKVTKVTKDTKIAG